MLVPGLTDEKIEQIWENKDKVLGQLVEIRADAATQSARCRRHVESTFSQI